MKMPNDVAAQEQELKEAVETEIIPPRYHFDEVEHIHYLDNKPLMGTTTILHVISKPSLLPWAAKMTVEYIKENCKKHNFGHMYYEVTDADLDEAKKQHTKKKEDAADWGKIVHKACEVWIKTNVIPSEVDILGTIVKVLPEHRIAIDHFVKWATDNKAKFIRSEEGIYSEKWWVGGQVDFVCEIDGKLVVGDIKTSSGIWEEYWLQVAAYSKMMVEMGLHDKFDQMTIINTKKDGKVKVETRTNIEECIKAFEAAIVLYKYGK